MRPVLGLITPLFLPSVGSTLSPLPAPSFPKGAPHAQVHYPFPRRRLRRLHLRGGGTSAEEAVDLVYEGLTPVAWQQQGVTEFDAVRMSAIDDQGEDIDGYTRGKG